MTVINNNNKKDDDKKTDLRLPGSQVGMALKRRGGLDGVGNKKWSLIVPHFIYPEEKTGTTHPSLEGLHTSPGSWRDDPYLQFDQWFS